MRNELVAKDRVLAIDEQFESFQYISPAWGSPSVGARHVSFDFPASTGLGWLRSHLLNQACYASFKPGSVAQAFVDGEDADGKASFAFRCADDGMATLVGRYSDYPGEVMLGKVPLSDLRDVKISRHGDLEIAGKPVDLILRGTRQISKGISTVEEVPIRVWPGQNIHQLAQDLAKSLGLSFDEVMTRQGLPYRGPDVMVPVLVELAIQYPGWKCVGGDGRAGRGVTMTKEVASRLSLEVNWSLSSLSSLDEYIEVGYRITSGNVVNADEFECRPERPDHHARNLMKSIEVGVQGVFEHLGATGAESAALAGAVLRRAFPLARDTWAVTLRMEDGQTFDWIGQADDKEHARGLAHAQAVDELRQQVFEEVQCCMHSSAFIRPMEVGAAEPEDEAQLLDDHRDAGRSTYRG